MRFTAAGVALLIALPAAAQVQLTVRGDGKKIISNVGAGFGVAIGISLIGFALAARALLHRLERS